jgi:hypothetical protein
MSSVWDTTFLNIANVYRDEWYKLDYEPFIVSLAELSIKTACLVQLYGVLTRQKKIPTIKEMDQQDKEELKKEVLRIAIKRDNWKNGEREKYLNDLFKAIYAFSQYTQI